MLQRPTGERLTLEVLLDLLGGVLEALYDAGERDHMRRVLLHVRPVWHLPGEEQGRLCDRFAVLTQIAGHLAAGEPRPPLRPRHPLLSPEARNAGARRAAIAAFGPGR